MTQWKEFLMKTDVLSRKGGSYIDVTLSWHMFWQNAKPFLTVQGISIYISLAITSLLWFYSPNYHPQNYLNILSAVLYVLLLLFEIAEFLMLLAFQGNIYGLAFDIMSSGDQFAEIQGISRYFKKFLVKFIILGMILALPVFFFIDIWVVHNEFLIEYVIVLSVIFSIGLFLFFVVFGQVGPALIYKKGIISAFKESISGFLKAPKRIFKTWALFWGIFYLPQLITSISVMTRISPFLVKDITLIPLLAASLGVKVWYYLIGIPIQALIATRIYNSLHLNPKQD